MASWTPDAKPSATACASYTFNNGNDNVYPCVNGLNDGQYADNNLQMFDNTWYHKFSQSWHMATEAWYMGRAQRFRPHRTRKGHKRCILFYGAGSLPCPGVGDG